MVLLIDTNIILDVLLSRSDFVKDVYKRQLLTVMIATGHVSQLVIRMQKRKRADACLLYTSRCV